MSTTNGGTQYQLTMTGGVTGGAKVSVNLQIPASDTFGDAEMKALVNGLLAAFPAAWNVNAATNVSKTVQNATTYAAPLTGPAAMGEFA